MAELTVLPDARSGPNLQNYRGPERRTREVRRWPAMLLDEIDYGVMLVDARRRLLHANRVARVRLRSGWPLLVTGEALCGSSSDDTVALDRAISAAACRHLRRLVSLGSGADAVEVAVVPLPEPRTESAFVMLLVSRPRVCEPLSAYWYARSHGLTAAEGRVLNALCTGCKPSAVAATLGVALSTVRSQISTIRAKTGAASIRELLDRVSQLPPIVSALGI